MASTGQRLLEVLVTWGVVWLALYILQGTFGLAMSAMYVDFGNALALIHMSAGWNAVCINELNQWPVFYNGITAMIITIAVWAFKSIIIEGSYSRYNG